MSPTRLNAGPTEAERNPQHRYPLGSRFRSSLNDSWAVKRVRGTGIKDNTLLFSGLLTAGGALAAISSPLAGGALALFGMGYLAIRSARSLHRFYLAAADFKRLAPVDTADISVQDKRELTYGGSTLQLLESTDYRAYRTFAARMRRDGDNANLLDVVNSHRPNSVAEADSVARGWFIEEFRTQQSTSPTQAADKR